MSQWIVRRKLLRRQWKFEAAKTARKLIPIHVIEEVSKHHGFMPVSEAVNKIITSKMKPCARFECKSVVRGLTVCHVSRHLIFSNNDIFGNSGFFFFWIIQSFQISHGFVVKSLRTQESWTLALAGLRPNVERLHRICARVVNIFPIMHLFARHL